jgi:ribonuclease HI
MAVRLFTDGACSENPGPGGWAVVIESSDGAVEDVISGYDIETTNNKMELTAVIQAYKKVLDLKVHDPRDETEYEIVSDSAYVVNAVTHDWIGRWSMNGWKNSKGEKVKNIGLWNEFLTLHKMAKSAKLSVKFKKVKGHSGNMLNEVADKVAVAEKVKAVQMKRAEKDMVI